MAEDDGNGNQGGADDDQYGEEVCRVYDKNDFFTVFVQMLLGVVALMSLYIKRLQEVPRRTFNTWFLDVSKQGFGACYAHVLNMVRKLGWQIFDAVFQHLKLSFISFLLDNRCRNFSKY